MGKHTMTAIAERLSEDVGESERFIREKGLEAGAFAV
jgi:hypothetical protein